MTILVIPKPKIEKKEYVPIFLSFADLLLKNNIDEVLRRIYKNIPHPFPSKNY